MTASPVDERRGDVLDDELARLDPDPGLEPELVHRLEHRERGRTARSASSSCVCGTPNAAITASPANFSTVPPWRLMLPEASLEVARHAPADDLGVAGADERRRIDEVDEDHRCELAFHRFILGSATG